MQRARYQRLSTEDRLLIENLTLEGRSLNFLSQITGIGKTTIYYQVRKFKPKRKLDFDPSKLTDFEIGELMGAFAGDGTFYHKKDNSKKPDYRYKIRYCLSLTTDRPYAQYLSDILARANLNPMVFTSEKQHRIELAINSKEFYNFIKEYLAWEEDKTFSVRLKKEVGLYPDEFLKGFARGLMDTDGFLNPSNAICACISRRLIDNLSDIFAKFELEITRTVRNGIKPRRDLFYVRVRRSSLYRYRGLIGFSNPQKSMVLNKILKNPNSKD